MTLPKHVASQRRTENKGIIMMWLAETHVALSKVIQNHDADFPQGLPRIEIANYPRSVIPASAI